ncbi:RNase adapter RapZ [Solemya velesiana gill symbiont]|uniref:RNase adaptor protein RapZ n=1 Tax=Solemya velesiana gill symbiont TaxID=1918948 RepID=A0A1T2KVF8_9GAMM|nr:RNase adapter RapZ [Solemya velesiana gill symbiont]OOZ36781.1 RNase adaptor protein RapZ [Solemya velesiana gill symbiont]
MKLVIVTGLSGSGKSIALHTLEDQGYYCIDNLPVFLLPALTEELSRRHDHLFNLIAVSIDARSPSADLSTLSTMLRPLKEREIQCEVIFLEAQDDTLIKRFSETRRKHPLTDEERPLAEAIELERSLLEPFLTAAALRIDTTHTTLHELRRVIRSRVGERANNELSLLFQSFGFKHGVPRDADFVYDVRCLPNPHWHQALRPLTGRDEKVQRFLESDDLVQHLKEEIIGFLEHWIPCFESDGRNYLTVAVGCTGGQHRSVYLTEKLADHFNHCGRNVQTRHRELP